jgi:hypothetical protein
MLLAREKRRKTAWQLAVRDGRIMMLEKRNATKLR